MASNTFMFSKKLNQGELTQSDPSQSLVDKDKGDTLKLRQKPANDFATVYKSNHVSHQSFLKKIEDKLLTIQLKQGNRGGAEDEAEQPCPTEME